MRKFLIFVFSFVLCLSLSLTAFADEIEVTDESKTVVPVVVYDSVADNPDYELTDVQFRSVSPVTPSDTSGLKAALLGVLGDYDAIVAEYQYTSSQGYVSYLREVQPDYVWIASAALLGLVIYCLFRMGGALIG